MCWAIGLVFELAVKFGHRKHIFRAHQEQRRRFFGHLYGEHLLVHSAQDIRHHGYMVISIKSDIISCQSVPISLRHEGHHIHSSLDYRSGRQSKSLSSEFSEQISKQSSKAYHPCPFTFSIYLTTPANKPRFCCQFVFVHVKNRVVLSSPFLLYRMSDKQINLGFSATSTTFSVPYKAKQANKPWFFCWVS